MGMSAWGKLAAAVSLALSTLVSCSSSSGAHVASDGTVLTDGFNVSAPPAGALQVVTPIVKAFPAGGNVEYCYFSKQILTEETAFKAGQGFQAKGGHHAVVYWTTQVQPEQMRPCTEDDMVTFHVLSGGGGEAGNGIVNNLPAGGAFHVPAGAQLVVNLHLLNSGDHAVDGQAAVNLFYGEKSLTPLTSFYVSGTSFTIAPRETKTYSASCVAKTTIKVTRLLGHMHEWGVRNTITITDATGDHLIYDKPGSGDFSYNPPFLDYPADKPLVINPGDKVTASCTWTNTRDTALSFPDEMCAAFGYVVGTDPESGCADGVWNR